MSNVVSKNSAINVVNLEKSVTTQEGSLTILKGINLDVKQGESVAILGPSGSGKSTLLGLLAALDTPTAGEIWLDGEALSPLNEEQKAALRKQKVSFIFQSRVGLSHRLTHLPKQLSGGEQQRVAIARAFICEPKVLFADEPTGNLDSVNGHKIADMLFELNQESHTTLILVTHDLQLAKRCQRQLVMDNGHLQEELGAPQPHNVNDNLELSAKEA